VELQRVEVGGARRAVARRPAASSCCGRHWWCWCPSVVRCSSAAVGGAHVAAAAGSGLREVQGGTTASTTQKDFLGWVRAVVRMGCFGRKLLPAFFVGGDGGGALGCRSPSCGHHLGAPSSMAWGSLGENPIQFSGRATGTTRVIPSLEAPSLETQLGFGIASDDGSREVPIGGGARRHGAGWRASWGLLSSHGGARNFGGGQGLSHLVGVAAGSGPRRLVLLDNCQCSAGHRQETALVAVAAWDDLACSKLWRVAQLCWATPVWYIVERWHKRLP
jgi:hypothetical protein